MKTYEIILIFLGGYYFTWVLLIGWQELRTAILRLRTNIKTCLPAQIRLWRRQYTDNEKQMLEDFYIGLPEAYKPSPPWFEVKYNLLKIVGVFTDPYNSIKFWLGNAFYYWQVVLNDSWFDHSFLLKLIEVKVRRDAAKHEKYGMCERSYETAAQLREVADLCKRIREENYLDKDFERHTKKWGNFIWERNFVAYPHAKRAKTPILQEQERNEFNAIYAAAEIALNNDVKRLSELFLEIRNWWD